MSINIEAIRARDAAVKYTPTTPQQDRRDLLAYVDELRVAAGKVTCAECSGTGFFKFGTNHDPSGMPCACCADLRRLMGEKT